MRRMTLALASAAVLGCASADKSASSTTGPSAPKAGLYAILGTARGDVEVRLFKDDAPKSVAAFVEQGKAGAYDGMSFSRAVPGFLIQAAARKPGGALPFESVSGRGFQDAGRLAVPAVDGVSVPGEFFVTLLPAPWLDGKHAVFGEVTKGLELLAAASMEPRKERGPGGAFADAPLKPLLIGHVRFEDRP